MTTCPVCEHQQAAGAECEVCGHALAAAGTGEVAVQALEGLEPTAQPGAASAPEAAVLAELEPTLQPAAGAVEAALIPELEPTVTAPVEVPAEPPIPDLEPTSSPAGDARTELPLFPVCRYCRTPAGPGERICGRCGMRLPLEPAVERVAPGAEPRRCSCGAPITRSICPACGARHRLE